MEPSTRYPAGTHEHMGRMIFDDQGGRGSQAGASGPKAGLAAEGRESTISPPVYGPAGLAARTLLSARKASASADGRRVDRYRTVEARCVGASPTPKSYAADRSPRCR